MSTINKVALAGSTGNLGPAILNTLLSAGFQVTILTRKSSTHTFPSNVAVKSVEYDSLDSLVSALQGQDALVSTLGSGVIEQQLLLVEAAGKAGVKRFIPSDLPVFQPKIAVQEALKKQASSSRMSYTVVCTGPFLDWGIMVGFIMNDKGKSINLYDGGDRIFSTTSLPAVGKAVVGVLRNLDATRDRAVYVHEAATTLKALATMGKRATGGPDGWKEEVVSTDELLAKAWEELKKEKPHPDAFVYNFIFAGIWGEGYGSHFEKLDNELLGVRQLGDGELQELVNRYV